MTPAHARTGSLRASKEDMLASQHPLDHSMPLSVIIFGATGDLAKKKLFPALYQLCLLGHFPRDLHIVGYGRSAVDLPSFVAKQCVNIKADARLPVADFTARIAFHAGGYDEPSSYERLAALMTAHEGGR